MSKQYHKPSVLLHEVQRQTLNDSPEIPREIFERRVEQMTAELDGIVESSMNGRELDRFMHVEPRTKRVVVIGTNATTANTVIMEADWEFAPGCKAHVKHSANDETLSFIAVRTVYEKDKKKIRFKITKPAYSTHMQRSLELTTSNESNNKSKVEFDLDDAGKLTVRATGAYFESTREEILKVYGVDINRLQKDRVYCEEWYAHFRKIAFSI